jgi:hypothetical protein
VWLKCNKKLHNGSSEETTFVELFQKFAAKLNMEELQLFVIIARQL